jgi:hypothetical protein
VAASKEARALEDARMPWPEPLMPPPHVDLEQQQQIRGAGGAEEARERRIAYVGEGTFYRVDGKWIDSEYDEKVETTKIEVFSEEYFELLRKHEDLARCFALGDQVIVVVGDKAYETISAKAEKDEG